MSVEKWILVDIGCIECGEESKFVGFFDSEEEATKFWNEEYYDDKTTDWGRKEWGGQHRSLVEKVSLSIFPK